MEMTQAAALSRFDQAGVETKYGEFYLFDGESEIIYRRKKRGKEMKPYFGNKFRYANLWRVIAPHGE